MAIAAVERLNAAGWAHLLFFGAYLPVVVVLQARRIAGRERPLPARLAHFRATCPSLFLLTGSSIAVALLQGIRIAPFDVPHLGRGLAAGVAMYAATVWFMRPRWRRAVEQRSRVVHLFMADTSEERCWWLAVSMLAGVGEEIT